MAQEISQDNLNHLVDLLLSQNKYLVQHLHSSYQQLMEEIIPYSLRDENNYFYENVVKDKIYLHGFKITNIAIRPVEINGDLIFPRDARKKHLNYFGSIVGNVSQFVITEDLLTGKRTTKTIGDVQENVVVANVPIMVKSKYCSTTIKNDLAGECKYDLGGYFIVNGAEKVVMSIEKMAPNKVFVHAKKDNTYPQGFHYVAQINSKKNDWTDNLQIITLKNNKEGDISFKSSQFAEIPIGIILRAYGLETDKDILTNIVNDLNDEKLINAFRPSLLKSVDENGNLIRTKEEAYQYLINKLKYNKRINVANEQVANVQRKILLDKIFETDMLPHLGNDKIKKIKYLGYMIKKLLIVLIGRRESDNRDSIKNKRVETPGVLIGQLFRQNWKKMLIDIGNRFKKRNQNDENPIDVVNLIKPNIIEQGIKSAMSTGIWGMHKSKKGVAQAIIRLSYIKTMTELRRVMAPTPDKSTSGVTSIRMVDNGQLGFLCFIETPEGAKIGIAKNLSMSATISLQNSSQKELIENLLNNYRDTFNLKHCGDINGLELKNLTKVFLNGDWLYSTKSGINLYNKLRQDRIDGIIDKFTTVTFDYIDNEINLWYDEGRMIRPLLKVKDNQLVFNKKMYDTAVKFFKEERNTAWNKFIEEFKEVVEYEDTESVYNIMVAPRLRILQKNKSLENTKVENDLNRYGETRYVKYTHCELHPWLLLGSTVSCIPFSNHNYGTKNIVNFSQVKQSIGIYLSSYKDRMDKSNILYHPQLPIVTTQAMKYNNMLDLPFGENAIVAIMSYTGYNQEDSLIFNQSALDRGLFRADTLEKFSAEIQKNPSTSQDDAFMKPDRNRVTGMKQANYDKLNEKGFVPEETEINDGDVIIGKVSPIQPSGNNNKVFKDSSVIFKTNVKGVVDRVHTGIYNNEGYEIYNMRVRMERVPIVGDKFCLTPDHEVLTTNGWKNINNISLTDKVCCLDKNQNIYYSNPLKLWEFDHDGDMYSISSSQVNLITTLNHKMYVKQQDKKHYELIEAKDIYGKRVTFKKNGNNTNKNIDTFKIPNTNKEIKMNDFLVILCDWLSKGNIVNKIDKDLYNYLTSIDRNNQKLNLPEVIFELSQEQSKLLLDRLVMNNMPSLKASNYNLKDCIQKLALHSGLSLDIYHDILMINEDNDIINNNEEIIKYKGKVYCIEVPDHVFYVRREGIPVWTGNSNRYGQKGTLGITLAQKDMPFTKDGMVPDLIMNPHAIPSRMTVAQLIESMIGKIGAIEGKFMDGTPFSDYDVTQLPKILKKLGYKPYGTEELYCGMTGRKMKSEIFMGPTYYIRLKHMTLDKIHGRASGPKQALTRQPLDGRSRGGGLRIGEMEKDAMVAHGASQFLKERMNECSDLTKVYVCDNCGLFAQKVMDKNYYKCVHPECKDANISAVAIPFACKLLFQELMSVNIVPRIRTEQTVYGDNI
ncbi:DNA-directed RNA polymerase subunit Rpb2 precursor [Chlorella virus XW01]|nr:DNA-directed RNA polymerase subunit Rpb2 precursor [Chlorella virus XW01]